MIRRSTSALVLAVCLTVSTTHAEPSPSDVATAKSLLVEGRQLRAQNKHDLARDKFKAAWVLVPTPIIGLDLARAYVACGQYVEAREVALEVTRLPEGPKESAEGKAARVEATKLAAEAKGKIASLVVKIEGLSGRPAQATIDGEPVPVDTLGLGRKLNPGMHAVVVTVGGIAHTKHVQLADGASASVTVIVGAPAPGVTAKESAPPSTLTDAASRPTWPWVAVGLGATGVLVGGVFAALALGKESAIRAECPTDCAGIESKKTAVDDLRSSRTTFQIAAVALGGVGLAAGALGVWGLTREPAKVGGVQLLVGAQAATVRITF